MSNIVELFKQFKNDTEKQLYIEKQHNIITSLINKNKQLQEEIDHLKLLLTSVVPSVEKIIVTKEEALIDSQIDILSARSLGLELSLEDTKKLDLLLKNKKLFREDNKSIDISSKKVSSLSKEQLIQIALKKENS